MAGASTTRYAYDHDIARGVYFDGTATTSYPNKCFSREGATTTRHFFANGELLATIEGYGSATSTIYVHTDHLGGTNVLTNSDGGKEQLVDYFRYGSLRLNGLPGRPLTFATTTYYWRIKFWDANGLEGDWSPVSSFETANKTVFQDLHYTYDKVGNITKIVSSSDFNSAKTIKFTYDDLHCLISASTTDVFNSPDYN